MEHPLFGHIEYSKHDGWQREGFSFWGSDDVQLLIHAGEAGPTPDQEAAFKHLAESTHDLLPKCIALVDGRRKELEVAPGAFRVSCLSIPSMTNGTAGHLWTVWFDLNGDDHFMYGVQTEDGWKTLNAFADD